MNPSFASRRRLWSAVSATLRVSAALPLFGVVPAAIAADESVLEEVVVTATRRTESIQDIPVSITAVSADVLATAGVVDARDLVALAPNLSTQGSFGRTAPSFFIRGIGNLQFNTNAELEGRRLRRRRLSQLAGGAGRAALRHRARGDRARTAGLPVRPEHDRRFGARDRREASDRRGADGRGQCHGRELRRDRRRRRARVRPG